MKRLKIVLAILAVLLVASLSGCQKDDLGIRPTVISTNPVNNATNVATNSPVTVTFSNAMNPATLTVTEFTLMQGTTRIAGSVSCTGPMATFNPTVNLEANKIYTGTITTGAKNMHGEGLLTNHVFTFTCSSAPDIALPTVVSTSPVSAAAGVERNKTVVIIFSEAMNPTTITSSTFTLKKGASAIAGTVTYLGLTASYNPTNTLEAATAYTATITSGAKDLAGNALAVNTVWSFTTGGSASSLSGVNLGAAANYVILAKSAINNSSATTRVVGDLGLSPAATSYITGMALTDATGYATSALVTGNVFAADMAPPTPINLTTAVSNMITAYNDAAGRPSPDFSELGTGNIGGKTLTPGLYKWTSTVTLPSSVTISGGANDVWIFQISGNLTMSAAVRVTLIGGAQAKNIFWQVAGQATLGTTSHFEGIILSMTGITFQTGASITGRALAQTAVVLDANAVTGPQ